MNILRLDLNILAHDNCIRKIAWLRLPEAQRPHRDYGGYHILSITTKGELWIPDDWPKLKSWVNGKSVYLKGMKPTPNSK